MVGSMLQVIRFAIAKTTVLRELTEESNKLVLFPSHYYLGKKRADDNKNQLIFCLNFLASKKILTAFEFPDIKVHS